MGLVPEAVGPAKDVLDCQVHGLDVDQGDLLVAEGQDAVQMRLNALSKLMIRVHPAPLEKTHPLEEEPPGAHFGLVAPEVRFSPFVLGRRGKMISLK